MTRSRLFSLVLVGLLAGEASADSSFACGSSAEAAFDTRGVQYAAQTDVTVHEGGELSSSETWAAGRVHVVAGTVVVPAGVTLVIEPRAIVKFTGGGFVVRGSVVANGATLTDVDDDSVGGDTRGNGDVRAMGSFELFGPVETDADTFVSCARNLAGFSSCASTPFGFFDWRATDPNVLSGACVHAGGLLATSETWSADSIHIVYGTLTIPTNETLTIARDAVVKFTGGGLVADGSVIAGGVTFADIDDDTYGGDTRKNGEGNLCASFSMTGDLRTDGETRVVGMRDNDVSFAYSSTAWSAFNTRGIEAENLAQNVALHQGGTLAENEAWSSNSVHIVYGTLFVPAGVTLTIEAGAIVKFIGGGLYAEGHVTALGVTFTDANCDTFGGDSLGNGLLPMAASYSLVGNVETDETTLFTCRRNDDSAASGGASAVLAYVVPSSSYRIAHTAEPIAFSTAWDDATSVKVSMTTPKGETIILTNGTSACSGVVMWEPPNEPGRYAFRHETDGTTLEADVYVARDVVVHEGWLTGSNTWDTGVVHLINGTVTLKADAVLTVEPGVIVKAMPETRFVIEDGGVCNARGAVFTHADDDSVGGDLFGDGVVQDIPENEYWVLGCVNDDVTTEYRYAQRSMSGRIVADCEWETNRVYVIDGTLTVPEGISLTIPAGTIVKFTDDSNLVIEDGGVCAAEGAIFTHVADDAAGGDTLGDGAETVPQYGKYAITGNVIDNEDTEYRYTAPVVLNGTIAENATWRARSVYRITGDLTIANGAKLTIMPGAVVKMDAGVSLTVNEGGSLEAIGLRASPIVFTSIGDDDWGGDTNGDGSETSAQVGDWASIYVYGNVSMSHVRIRYGGKNGKSPSDVFYLDGGKVTFDNSVLEHSFEYCVGLERGTWAMANSVFDDFYTAFRHFAACTCDNSVFYNFSYLSNNGGQTFRNCVIDHFSNALCWWEDNCTYCNCLIYNEPGFGPQSSDKTGQGGNIWGDPLFANPENGNFRISVDSPCVDAGDTSAAPSTDCNGQPRVGAAADIGIYEAMPRYVASDVDLRVDEISVSGTGIVGDELVVSWIVENNGTASVSDFWRDKVEIVSARGDKIELGEKLIKTGLTAGGKRTYSSRWNLPVLAEGEYTVQVTANYARDVFEGTLTENNIGSSASFAVSVPTAEAASGASATVRGGDESILNFTIDPTSADRLITITATEGMYALFGTTGVPTESYNVGKVSASEGAICFIVPDNVTDVYIRLVNGSDDDAECEMSFSTAKVKILDVSPRTIPYDGKVTVRVEGAGLNRVKSVAFKAADATLVPCANWRADSSDKLVISADGMLLRQGAEYRVTLIDENGAETDAEQRVSVTQEPARPEVWAKMNVPETVRDGRQYLCSIEYGNKGNADAVAPILHVAVNGDGWVRSLTDELLMKNRPFIGVGASDNAGRLVPGETRKIEFTYVAGSESESDTLTLTVYEKDGLASAAERLARRGEDATDYFAAKELAEKIAAGEPCGVYYGYVRDADGYPVSDYCVMITNGETVVSAVSDANGHYVAEACLDADERVDHAVPNVASDAYVEVLGSIGTAVGVTAFSCESGVMVAAECGRDGLFRFRGIADGTYLVTARDGDRLASGVIIVSGLSFYPVHLTLSEPCSIQGTFTDDGLEGSTIVMLAGNGFHRMSDVAEDGTFCFTGLPAGSYSVRFVGESYADYSAVDELVVSNGVTAFCSIAKTNNIALIASAMPQSLSSSLCSANAVQLMSSGVVTENNIGYYLQLLAMNPPSSPPAAKNCEHNQSTYKSAQKLYWYVNDTLYQASYTKAELNHVQNELNWQLEEAAIMIVGAIAPLKKAVNALDVLMDALFAVMDARNNVLDIIDSAAKANTELNATMAVLSIAKVKGDIISLVALKEYYKELGQAKSTLSGNLAYVKDSAALVEKLQNALNCIGSVIGILESIKMCMDRTQLIERRNTLRALLDSYLDYANLSIGSVLHSPYYPYCCEEEPEPKYPDPSLTNKLAKIKSSDPNEVAGPIGLGDPNTERFMRPGEWMTYTVYFENASNATAGAQEVFVTNPLSEWLDWDTFEMGEVAFANQIDTGLSGLQVGQSEVDFADTVYRVQSNVSIDKQTGVVDWYLRLVDPSTASTWPADPYAGFLQPNDETHCGEGHLTYRVKVREDAPRNIVIENAASIVFDYNEAIATDPSWWNTVGWPLTVGEAVNNETLTWTTGGATNWVPVLTENAPDTNHLAIAYGGQNNTNVWLSTEVDGPGTITFAWSSQLAARNTKGYFLVDGEVEAILTGTNDWVTANVVVWGEGTHVLEWRLNTGRSGADEGDALALDAVDWASKTLVPPTLAEALNTGMKWTTTGEATWRGVARVSQRDSREAWAAVDGLGDLECAAVETRVYGTGTLRFDWAVSCEQEYDELVLLVDGKQRKRITGNVGWRTVSILVEGTSWHSVRWEYVKDELDEEELVGDNRAMLDNVVWTSEDDPPRNTEQTPVPVPYDVIDASYKAYLDAAGGDYDAAALSLGKNGVAIWESYVAGLDPEDEKSKFTAVIEIVDGVAEVTWEPDLNEGGTKSIRKYTTFGCQNLGDEWKDMGVVLEADKPKYHFFKVTVEMP